MKNNKRGINWKVLIVCLLIVYASAFVGSIFTTNVVNSSWYETIKPSITPPNYIFPIAWGILFTLIGISLYFAWVSANKKEKKLVAIVFAVNLALNILWSIFYFGNKMISIALVDLILMWLTIVWMILVTWKIDKKSAYCLVPYLLWVSFAGRLNYLSI